MYKKTIEVDFLISETVYITGYSTNKYVPLKATIQGYNIMPENGKTRYEQYWMKGLLSDNTTEFYEPKTSSEIFKTPKSIETHIPMLQNTKGIQHETQI